MLRKCSAGLCVLLCLLFCACGSGQTADPPQPPVSATDSSTPAATTATPTTTAALTETAAPPTETTTTVPAAATSAAAQTTTAPAATTASATQTTTRPAAATPPTTTTRPAITKAAATTRAAAATPPTTAARTTRPTPTTTAAPKTTAAPTTTQPQTLSCTLSIDCKTLLDHLDELESGKRALVPANGVLLAARSVSFTEGESVFDVLKRVCRQNGLQMEFTMTPVYQSAYIEGIGNLYEFDGGPTSGWMYSVNGVYPNCGCSAYTLQNGDTVLWRYTCALGADIGGRNQFQ